ncbi:MAG: tryptophan synthase subunit alpha [Thermodesulfobacteriota bacterium]
MPFIVAGDPDLEITEALVFKIAESGADMIELGLPFSDPIADGPVIQASSQRALKKGVNLNDIFHLTGRLNGIDIPLVIMTYFNPILRFGLGDFAKRSRDCRIDGVIIPDLPPEEAGAWISEARRVNLDTIFLLTPRSSEERIRKINRLSRGFIYYVSVEGVTGMRERLSPDLEMEVKRIKGHTKKPVCVGFGISNPLQVKEIGHFADGVIIGSAIIKIIEENLKDHRLFQRIQEFISSLKKELKRY